MDCGSQPGASGNAPPGSEPALLKMGALLVVKDALPIGELREVQVAAEVHFEEDGSAVRQCYVPVLRPDTRKDGGGVARVPNTRVLSAG